MTQGVRDMMDEEPAVKLETKINLILKGVGFCVAAIADNQQNKAIKKQLDDLAMEMGDASLSKTDWE